MKRSLLGLVAVAGLGLGLWLMMSASEADYQVADAPVHRKGPPTRELSAQEEQAAREHKAGNTGAARRRERAEPLRSGERPELARIEGGGPGAGSPEGGESPEERERRRAEVRRRVSERLEALAERRDWNDAQTEGVMDLIGDHLDDVDEAHDRAEAGELGEDEAFAAGVKSWDTTMDELVELVGEAGAQEVQRAIPGQEAEGPDVMGPAPGEGPGGPGPGERGPGPGGPPPGGGPGPGFDPDEGPPGPP